MVVCGQFMQFLGIQLVLEDDKGKKMYMSQIGSNTPCDSWTLPNGTYFQEIQIGYDTDGVTYLKAVTNNEIQFERGELGANDSSSRTVFTPG